MYYSNEFKGMKLEMNYDLGLTDLAPARLNPNTKPSTYIKG